MDYHHVRTGQSLAMLSCPAGWGWGCLGHCRTQSRECLLMAVGARGRGRVGGAGWMGWAAGRGRAWDLASVPNLLQASPFTSLSLSFLPPQWGVGAGRSKPPGRDRETGSKGVGQGLVPRAAQDTCSVLASASPGPPHQLSRHISVSRSTSVRLPCNNLTPFLTSLSPSSVCMFASSSRSDSSSSCLLLPV